MLAVTRKLRWVVLAYVLLTILLAVAAIVLAEQRSGRTPVSNALDTALIVSFCTTQVVAFLYALFVRPSQPVWPTFDFDLVDKERKTPEGPAPRSTRMLSRKVLRWIVVMLSPLCVAALALTLFRDGALLNDRLYDLVFGIGLLAVALNIPASILYTWLVKPTG